MVNKKKTDSKKIKINKYLIAGLIITGIVIIIGIISAFATLIGATKESTNDAILLFTNNILSDSGATGANELSVIDTI